MVRPKKKKKKLAEDGGESTVRLINTILIGVLLFGVFVVGVIFAVISFLRGAFPEMLLATGFLLWFGGFGWAFQIAWYDEPGDVLHVFAGFMCGLYWFVFCVLHYDRYLFPLLITVVGFLCSMVGAIAYEVKVAPHGGDFDEFGQIIRQDVEMGGTATAPAATGYPTAPFMGLSAQRSRPAACGGLVLQTKSTRPVHGPSRGSLLGDGASTC